MKILPLDAILKVTCYSDIFSSDEKEAKKQFRKYCRLYHPDNGSTDPKVAQAYEIVQKYYHLISGSHCTASVNDSYVFRDKKTNKGFEINNPVIIDNGTCMIYHTATKIVLRYTKEFEKFYDKYVANVKLIRYDNDKIRNEFEITFPKMGKHFETTEGDFIILLDKTSEVLNLGLIVASYEKMGTPFPEKHAAWIMNRLFNHAMYMSFCNKVFNGFSLTDLWVSPEFHTVLLLNGWEYSTNVGDKMIGCPKEVYKVLPVKARDTHKSVTETDLESIKAIGRTLFKDSSATAVKEYFDSGLESSDVLEEWNSYGKAVKSDFGKRAFVVWDNVPYNKI